MKPESLQNFGLSQIESKIYLALLENGSSTADKISQKSGIHRRTIYDNIEKLLAKGLVSYIIKGGKKYFNAAEPQRLKDMLREKKEQLDEQEKALEKLLPELSLAQKSSDEGQEVNVYKGKEGVKTILWDILRTKQPNCVIGAHSNEEFKDMLARFHKERVKRKIGNRMIFRRDDIKRAIRFCRLPYTDVRVMPTEYVSPIAINIYGGKVGLLIRSANPTGILIANNDTAKGMRAYFEVLWNSCEKLA